MFHFAGQLDSFISVLQFWFNFVFWMGRRMFMVQKVPVENSQPCSFHLIPICSVYVTYSLVSGLCLVLLYCEKYICTQIFRICVYSFIFWFPFSLKMRHTVYMLLYLFSFNNMSWKSFASKTLTCLSNVRFC